MIELQQLLVLEQQNPTDDKILSQLAFYYLKNPDGNKELDYFKQAYELNPSIKNSHNYAFWAYYEYGQDELAQQLFQEIIAKNPKSFYPYMAYADIFTSKISKFTELENAKNHSDLLIMLYQKALELFNHCSHNYKESHYHEYAKIHQNLANICLMIDDFEKANSYYQHSFECIKKLWDIKDKLIIPELQIDELSYYFCFNYLIFYLLRDSSLNEYWLNQAKNHHSFYNEDIRFIQHKKGDQLKRRLRYFSKCWLFDCHNCHNLTDDE